ncbi:tubulin polyglutamylase TTLL4-like protein, partial [Dinothrombium tinctorium]
SETKHETKTTLVSNGIKDETSSQQVLSNVNLNSAILILILVVTLTNFLCLQRIESNHISTLEESSVVKDDINERRSKPKVWIQGQKMELGYLKHVFEVFERVGYHRVNGSVEDWDVLWAHEYPFTKGFFKTLKAHQKVNHFPGSGFITNKVQLATSDLRGIPKAFNLPKGKEKFLIYAKENPALLWVQKSKNHRGVKVGNTSDIDLDRAGTFVQQFIQNPLLIDGKKFDVGIYVILTSIKPLRVYKYNSDMLFRFCAKKYEPFNAEDIDSYVVGDDYTPIWEMPSLRKYFVDLNMNMKQSFEAYMRSIGKDAELVWRQIDESITSVYVAKETQMSHLSLAFNTTRHFFELVRFDYLIDENLNVYLMEVNMSPNLSSLHFAPNKLLYEQVIFNLLSLVGLTRTLDFHTWATYPSSLWNMRISNKDLSVHEAICASDECHLSCRSDKCKVCLYCMDSETIVILKEASLEHFSRWNCKRLIPSTDENAQHPSGTINELHRLWFVGKCLHDEQWC